MQEILLGILAIITIVATLLCWKNNGNGGGGK
jgi:hypothetical protein